MSHDAVPTGARAWVGAALVVLAVLSGVWTLRTLVAPGAWVTVCALLVAVVVAVTTAARSRTGSALAPTGWGAATAALAVASLYGGAGTGLSVPMPTMETVRRLSRLAEAGVATVDQGHIPVAPGRGLELLLVAAVLAVTLLVDLLALGLGRAGLAGLPLAALWSVPVVFERSLPVPAVLLGGTTFLLLLALTRPARPQDGAAGQEASISLVTAVGVTVLAMVTAPVVAALPFWGAVRLPTTWGAGPTEGPVALSLELDMRASLGPRSDRTLLTYTTDAGSLGPLRLYTLTEFDGSEWQRDTEPVSLREPDGLLWPADADVEPDPAGLSTLRVRVGDLDQDHLPVPVEPRSIDVPGDWRYDPVRDEVLSPTRTTRGISYEVAIAPRDLSQETLRADTAGTIDPASPYLHLPETPYAEQVGDIAAEVTAGAETTYDRALALQSWFRDTTRFSYDTRIPPGQSDDAVWDFLTEQRGYCVQYATAMTIMARHLGIPARMGVGFLPGRLDSAASGEYVVTGRLAHTWPELYFAEAGWVRFEPTPAAQTGAPPLYADPLATAPAAPEAAVPTASASPSAPAATDTTAVQQPAGRGEVSIGRAQVPILALVAGGLVVLAGALALALPRRRAEPAGPAGPEAAWSLLRGRLETLGVAWGDATTPRQAAALVRARWSSDVDVEAELALERLVAAVERERYAPAPGESEPHELARWVDDVVRPLEPAVEPVPAR